MEININKKESFCPHCKESVNPKATRCPHCHGKILRVKRILGGIVIFIFLIVILSSSFSGESGSSVPVEKYNDIEVCVESQILVTRYLKAPSTAKFPTCSHFEIKRLANDGFLVNSYVDSQNGFGAMLRSNWTVQYYYVGDKVITDVVIIDGEQLYKKAK